MNNGHLDFERLAAYWLGELPAAEAEEAEEHFFACEACAGMLEWLAELADGVRTAVRAGALGMVVTQPFVEAMKRAGMRLREYRTDSGMTTHCTIRADEDAVISRIRAPLTGVTRVDMVTGIEVRDVAQGDVRAEDVPFDATSGEVIFIPPPAALKKMPAHTIRVKLLAVEGAGERVIGDYTFAHTPS
jgi:anti-sigma factor RsiW